MLRVSYDQKMVSKQIRALFTLIVIDAAIAVLAAWFMVAIRDALSAVLVALILILILMLWLNIKMVRRRFQRDNGLALEITHAGVILPTLGYLDWEEVQRVRVHDMPAQRRGGLPWSLGGIIGYAVSASMRAWKARQGLVTRQQWIDFHLVDAAQLRTRLTTAQLDRTILVDLTKKNSSYIRAAYGNILPEGGFHQAAQAVTDAATANGIPIEAGTS